MACCCGSSGCCYPSQLTITLSGFVGAFINRSPIPNGSPWPYTLPACLSYSVFDATRYLLIISSSQPTLAFNVAVLNGSVTALSSTCGSYSFQKAVENAAISNTQCVSTVAVGGLSIARLPNTNQFAVGGNIRISAGGGGGSDLPFLTFGKVIDCTNIVNNLCCEDILSGTYSTAWDTSCSCVNNAAPPGCFPGYCTWPNGAPAPVTVQIS